MKFPPWKLKFPQPVLRLLLDASEHSLKLNEVIYASTISACEKASEWSCAVKLFQAPGRQGTENEKRITIIHDDLWEYMTQHDHNEPDPCKAKGNTSTDPFWRFILVFRGVVQGGFSIILERQSETVI